MVLVDRTGRHKTDKLKVPKKLTIILLTSRSAKLFPPQNIWQHVRRPGSRSDFANYIAALRAGCDG